MTDPVNRGSRCRRRGAALCLALCLALAWPGGPARAGDGAPPPFPALYPEAALFTAALARHAKPPLDRRVTGLTVPHHLLAADLLAQAFSRLAGKDYRRIVILCPDHFNRSRTPFAVAGRDFATCLGPVGLDTAANARLLASPLVTASNLFAQEHAVQALTPFLARFFPKARLVAVAIRNNSGRAHWDALAALLAPLLDETTLVVQSTDFSHYLPPAQAASQDQQTLRLLADPDPAPLTGLTQPGHVDSLGALYLQRRLQREIYRADPTTVANRNSQAYARTPVTRSTSYLVQYYSPDPVLLPGPDRYVFAGDTFTGRHVAKLLARPGKRRELVALVRSITAGAPLIVNLEGVLARRCPERPGPYHLCLPEGETLALLRDLGVVAAGLANNHARDAGPAGSAHTRRALAKAGIVAITPGAPRNLGPFRLAALTDCDNADPRRRGLLTAADLDRLGTRLKKSGRGRLPVVMIHWGREFATGPDERERALARGLGQAGAELILGAHPHRSWPPSADRQGVVAWSLGNFLFDQRSPQASGSLVEVRFFSQGTHAVRVLEIGNLYARLAGQPARPERYVPGSGP